MRALYALEPTVHVYNELIRPPRRAAVRDGGVVPDDARAGRGAQRHHAGAPDASGRKAEFYEDQTRAASLTLVAARRRRGDDGGEVVMEGARRRRFSPAKTLATRYYEYFIYVSPDERASLSSSPPTARQLFPSPTDSCTVLTPSLSNGRVKIFVKKPKFRVSGT